MSRVPILHPALAMTAMGVAALLGIAVGAPTSTSSSGSSGGEESQVNAPCSPTSPASPPSSSATPPPTSAPSRVVNSPGMVGVILSETTSSPRCPRSDAPLLQKAFAAAGIEADVQNAQGSSGNFQHIARSMIGEGVTVLIIDSIDQTSGAAVEQEADAAGIQVIDYDRVNLRGHAASYVSFGNLEVGLLERRTLADSVTGSTSSALGRSPCATVRPDTGRMRPPVSR